MVVDGRSGPNEYDNLEAGKGPRCIYEYRNAWNGRWKQVYIYSARIYEIGESDIVDQFDALLEFLGCFVI